MGGGYRCEGMFVYVVVRWGEGKGHTCVRVCCRERGSICVKVCLCMCWRGRGKYICEGMFVYVLEGWGEVYL